MAPVAKRPAQGQAGEDVPGGPAPRDHDQGPAHRAFFRERAADLPADPALPTDRSTPTAPIDTTSEDPPNETKGRGTPVIGMIPVTAPRFTTACRPSHPVIPPARSLPKLSGALSAIRMPAHSRIPNSART